MSQRIKLLHVIYTFPAGGCERLLSDLLKFRDSTHIEQAVVSMLPDRERIAEIERVYNVPYYTLESYYTESTNKLNPFLETKRFIEDYQPDMVKTWLPLANVYGGLVSRLQDIPVIWGIHACDPPPDVKEDPVTKKQIDMSRYVPSRIICCSEAVHRYCSQFDYPQEKLQVINNGTDTERFVFDAEGRARIRANLKMEDDAPLIGMAASYCNYKGHYNFLRAARLLLRDVPKARFVFCGKFADAENAELMSMVRTVGMDDHVHLLGVRDDMPQMYSAMDIHTLNSKSESFGLATSEALACETLCVATDVGVVREIVGDCGVVIPAEHKPEVLAEAWKYVLALPEEQKERWKKQGRERIVQGYSVRDTVRQYEQAYLDVASQENIGGRRPQARARIEIVIPTYNACAQLEQCVRSVFRHTNMEGIKLTIINDGSTDDTAEFLDRLARRHLGIKVIHLEKNYFKCRPLNIALQQATSEFIAFLDDDTEVTEGWLEGLLQPMLENKNIAMVGAKIVFTDGKIFAADHRLPARHSMGMYELDRGQRDYIKECDALAGTCTVMRTSLRDTVGEYDETLKWHEDIDYCIRARLKGHTLLYNGEVTVYHHHLDRQSGDVNHNHKLFNDKWTEVLKLFPLLSSHAVDKLFARATRAIDRKDWAEVHAALAEMEQYDARFKEPYWQGVALYELQRYEEALPYLLEVLERYGDSAHTRDAHVLLAWAYQYLGQREALAAQLERIRRLYPDLMERVQPGLIAA